jgi:hypothetical protein
MDVTVHAPPPIGSRSSTGGGYGRVRARETRPGDRRDQVEPPADERAQPPGTGRARRGRGGEPPGQQGRRADGGEKVFGPARATRIIFTGRFVPVAEALQLGLVYKIVLDAEVYRTACERVARCAYGPAAAPRAAKQAIDAGLDTDLAAGLAIERLHFAGLFTTEVQRAGMRSFIENGPGKATFAGR